jgi:hypothetical protein
VLLAGEGASRTVPFQRPLCAGIVGEGSGNKVDTVECEVEGSPSVILPGGRGNGVMEHVHGLPDTWVTLEGAPDGHGDEGDVLVTVLDLEDPAKLDRTHHAGRDVGGNKGSECESVVAWEDEEAVVVICREHGGDEEDWRCSMNGAEDVLDPQQVKDEWD